MSERAAANATAGASAWLVRAMLLVASGFFLWWGSAVYGDFLVEQRVNFRLDVAGFWGAVVLLILSGLAFGLATRFPFPRPRYAFGRLVLAVVALAPAIHVWWAVLRGLPVRGVLGRVFWFDSPEVAFIGAALAGVAIASGVGARRARG